MDESKNENVMADHINDGLAAAAQAVNSPADPADPLVQDRLTTHDLICPSSEISSASGIDLENHLRGLILGNGVPSTDPSKTDPSATTRPRPQANSLPPPLQPESLVFQQNISARQRPSDPSGKVPTASQKRLNQSQRRQVEGRAKQPLPFSSETTEVSGPVAQLSRARGSSQYPSMPGAQTAQQTQPSSHVQQPITSSATLNPVGVPRERHVNYQTPLWNRGVSRGQQFPTAQQSPQMHPYSDHKGFPLVPAANPLEQPRTSNYNPAAATTRSPQAQLHPQHYMPQQQYPRPAVQNRRLYEPGNSRHTSNNSYRAQNNFYNFHVSYESARAQANFLDQIANIEIPKAAISLEELQEKEDLRKVLESACRTAITEHECKEGANFDENTVSLKCFGSLASGFATHSADLDLALVSPFSNPDSSSPESEIPRILEKALLNRGYGVRLLTKTRVPIIKFCEKPPTELASKLLAERAKWEKERDAPPPPTMPKEVEPTKDLKVTEGLANGPLAKIATQKHPPTSTKADSTEGSISVEASKIGKVTNDTANSDVTDRLTGVKISDTKTTNKAKNENPKTPVASPEIRTESLVTLASKSNEELLRLYSLAMKEGWYEPHERVIIREFMEVVKEYGPDDDSALLEIARLPLQNLPEVLSRYRAPPEHQLDFPKTGVGIQCDINFSNKLALHNTQLLKCYGICDRRVRPMVLFVKAWAKRRKINSPYHGTLSSYGYVLMVLHYLVNIAQPPVVPNLQTTRKSMQDTSSENSVKIEGYSVRFWRSEAEIADLARRHELTHNRGDSVGALLRGFFQYYARPQGGFIWSTEILSLRTPGGILQKQAKGWTGAKTVVTEPIKPGQRPKEIRHRYLFAIEDPFETDHNIARTVVHNGIVGIRDEFRRAHDIISSIGNGKPTDDLFAEAENKDNLQYRAFGPMPRKDNIPVKKDGDGKDGSAHTKEKTTPPNQKNRKGPGGPPAKDKEAGETSKNGTQSLNPTKPNQTRLEGNGGTTAMKQASPSTSDNSVAVSVSIPTEQPAVLAVENQSINPMETKEAGGGSSAEQHTAVASMDKDPESMRSLDDSEVPSAEQANVPAIEEQTQDPAQTEKDGESLGVDRALGLGA